MAATFAPRVPTTAKRTRSLGLLKKAVLTHYKKHGRHHLPWRKTHDPYKILVSEMMLQQTQVDRVIPKYEAFIKKYPTANKLARAELSDVLALWSGLGYNRRAKYLWEAAKGGTKGIGPYTRAAVAVFAHNEPHVLIETNIRTVYIHHLFPKSKKVPDLKVLPYIVVPKGVEPRVWYAALMDYGAHLKRIHPNPSRRSTHHKRQTTFKGSDREIRGAILRARLRGARVSGFDPARVSALTKKLKAEGLY